AHRGVLRGAVLRHLPGHAGLQAGSHRSAEVRMRGMVSRSLAVAVVRMALESMRANKMRSFLTVLGVILGVGTVIGMGAMIQGLDATMSRQIRTFGSHVLWIRPFSMNGPQGPGGLPDSLAKRHYFTDEDMQAVREQCPSVGRIAPLVDVDN